MIIRTDPKTGKKTKIKNRDFRKLFQEEMNKKLRDKVYEALKKNYKKLEPCGHSIMSPMFFINDMEMPDEFVFGFTRKHYSNYRHYKETLYVNGNVVDYIFGVNNLWMLENLSGMVGWDKELYDRYVHLNGRGGLAGLCVQNIHKHFEKTN